LLAWEGDKLVGFAAYSFLWPAAGVTRSLYLKELYVVEEFRRSGIGQLLMQSIFDTAARNECSRVEWATDTFNADAQRFYERLGFKTLSTKVDYRVEGEQLLQATQAVSGASS
jgi:ribosomal protein S18 acetylase RimI-like enzyme